MKSLGVMRQLTVFLAASAGITVIAILGLSYLFRIATRSASEMAAASRARNATSFALVDRVAKVQSAAQKLLREKDPDELEKLVALTKSLGGEAESKIQAAGAGRTSVESAYRTLSRANQKVTEEVLRGDQALAQQLYLAEANPAFETLLAELIRFQEDATTSQERAAAESAAALGTRVTLLYTLVGVALVALAAFGILLRRSIATGLRGVVSALSQTSDSVHAGAGALKTASQALAAGANEQAASVEEISSSVEELTSTIRCNSETAQFAKELSGHARDAAERGESTMKELDSAMAEIRKSSDGISKIIQAIEAIAFQTNILALNAAVEAARAGEAGLGFAVVADEVRNLARRAADAAKDTASMIETAVVTSGRGSKVSLDVTAILKEILENSRTVHVKVAEIAAASHEQYSGVEQISKALNQMNNVTQSTAAQAGESAGTAERLNRHAAELAGCVDTLNTLVDGAQRV